MSTIKDRGQREGCSEDFFNPSHSAEQNKEAWGKTRKKNSADVEERSALKESPAKEQSFISGIKRFLCSPVTSQKKCGNAFRTFMYQKGS